MKASKPVTARRIWSDAMADRAIALGSHWLRTRQAAFRKTSRKVSEGQVEQRH